MPHPIFAEFASQELPVPPGHITDYLGTLTRSAHMQREQSAPGGRQTPLPPTVDEEYFEWIDILESAKRSSSNYTMLELGAGFGRWSSRAYAAARRLGRSRIHVGLVEAEPAHVCWIPEHMADNRIPSSDYQLYELALGAAGSTNWFYVCMPPGSANNSAKEWYGQGLANGPQEVVFSWKFGATAEPRAVELEKLIAPELAPLYRGREFALLLNGWVAMRTDNTPLSSILRRYDFIDLVDCDIQGEELTVFPEAIGELNNRVARVHIGTHSSECETCLREVFTGAGWKPMWDFTCFKTQSTPYGEVYFNDGVQTWLNPRYLA